MLSQGKIKGKKLVDTPRIELGTILSTEHLGRADFREIGPERILAFSSKDRLSYH